MLKKVIALSLALVLAVSVFGGCASTNAPAASPTAAPTEAAGATPEPAAEATPAPTTAGSLLPWTGDTVTIKAFASNTGVTEDVNSDVYKVYKQAVGNIDIQWEIVSGADFGTKAKLYLSSGEIPDLFWYDIGDVKDYFSSGMLLDFNKYLDYMPNWKKYTVENPALKSYETLNGEQFMIHDYLNDYPGEAWFCNKTELDKLGIAIPTNLTELEAALQKVKDTAPDVAPFHTFWGIGYYKSIFGSLLNAREGLYFDLADKKWKHAITTPGSKYKEMIALLADYYKKGFFNAEFSTMSNEQTEALITSNKWAFTFTYNEQMATWYKAGYGDKLPIDAEPFIPPAAQGVTPNIWCAYNSDSPYWGYMVSVKTKNPEMMASLIDTIISEKVSDAFQWGIEGVSYKIGADGKKEWIPEFLAKGTDAIKALGIWNILPPRYICKRDDRSLMSRGNEVYQKGEDLYAQALTAGTMVSYYYRNAPTFTEEESNEISSIMTTVNTEIEKNEALFILGKRPMTEWDAFVNEVKAAGNIDRAVEIYNNAKQAPDRIQSQDRNYVILDLNK